MAMPAFDALLATLSTGATPSSPELADGLRDLSTQIHQGRTNLSTHIDENTAAHENMNASFHEARRTAVEAHRMITSIEGPFNVLTAAIGNVSANTEAAGNTLL